MKFKVHASFVDPWHPLDGDWASRLTVEEVLQIAPDLRDSNGELLTRETLEALDISATLQVDDIFTNLFLIKRVD